jgi:hypothetical protein
MSTDGPRNLGLWMPGTAVLISLLLSIFTTPPAPLFDSRPTAPPIGVGLTGDIQRVEAGLWEDPVAAIARENGKAADAEALPERIATLRDTGAFEVVAVLLPGGRRAEDAEQRRRARYAVLAGLNRRGLIPDDPQHLGAHSFTPLCDRHDAAAITIPYELFSTSTLRGDLQQASRHVAVLWLPEDELAARPLARMQYWLQQLLRMSTANTPLPTKVIGPHSSQTLAAMVAELPSAAPLSCDAAKLAKTPLDIEIYSPFATAEERLLLDAAAGMAQTSRAPLNELSTLVAASPIKLLRTIADDRSNAVALVDELQRRGADPVRAARRMHEQHTATCSDKDSRQGSGPRIALVSEWDSFYSRALPRSIKREIGCRIAGTCAQGPAAADPAIINDPKFDWVLRYSYLRGLDGQLPGAGKDSDDRKPADKGDTLRYVIPGERADHDAQLDYLRRLADTIAAQDELYRSQRECGIGAIGILGSDPYDKLMVLQALKQRFPSKIFFSTDLDARLLQTVESNWTRNLVLASPFNLALLPSLQHDTPPFRDSMQSAAFLSVLLALDNTPFTTKQQFIQQAQAQAYAACGHFLTPGIYEIGNQGFIGLRSVRAQCSAPMTIDRKLLAADSPLALERFQRLPRSGHAAIPIAVRDGLQNAVQFYQAGLLLALLIGALVLQIWNSPQRGYRRWLTTALVIGALLTTYASLMWWNNKLLCAAIGLVALAAISASKQRNTDVQTTPAYVFIPLLLFAITLVIGYMWRGELTEKGFGEPLFFFAGISTWPTQLIRLAAIMIAIAAVCWGWHMLAKNKRAMHREFRLPERTTAELLQPLLQAPTAQKKLHRFGHLLMRLLLPLRERYLRESVIAHNHTDTAKTAYIDGHAFWIEHQLCGIPMARLMRTALFTWLYLVVTSLLFAIWPLEWPPIRGNIAVQVNAYMLLLSIISFNFLIFWVVDANLLLARFATLLSSNRAHWPREVHAVLAERFGMENHPGADDWLDVRLIARRTAAVNKIVYAPLLVMLLLMAARSSLFDNWVLTPSLAITYLLGSAVLLFAAAHLRRAAERARSNAVAHLKALILKLQLQPDQRGVLDQLKIMLDEAEQIREGAFARYTDQPIVHAVLIIIGSMGGSVVVDYVKATQL